MQPSIDKSCAPPSHLDNGVDAHPRHPKARVAVAQLNNWKGLLAIALDQKQNIQGLAALLADIDEWDERPTDDVIVEAILLFRDIADAAGSASTALHLMREPATQKPISSTA